MCMSVKHCQSEGMACPLAINDVPMIANIHNIQLFTLRIITKFKVKLYIFKLYT